MLANQIAAAVGPVFGKVRVVISTSDEQYKQNMLRQVFVPDPDGMVRFYTTIESAYAACTSNADDVIVLAGYANHEVAAGIAWSKSRIHVIGMDGGFRLTDQGAKIHMGGAIATAYVVNVTGTRNSFINIKFIQGSTAATALNVAIMGGEGNLYKNCSFIFEVANNLGGTTAQEVTIGEDSGTFIDCEFGADTLLTSAARQVMLVKTQTTEMKSCRFRGCAFKISSSNAGATFIRLNATTDILFTNLFENCTFQASVDSAGGIALTGGAVQTGTGTSKGTLNFHYPGFYNCGGALASSGYNAAVMVTAPTSVATAIKGIQPTA